MEIRLGTLEESKHHGTQFQFCDSISVSEYQSLKKWILNIFNYSQSLKLLEIVVSNESDIHNFIIDTIDEIKEKSIKWNGVNLDDTNFYRIESNRFFLNCLSSFKTFLEHSETILKRKFGSDSIQIKEYKLAQSSIYDNSFSYRFFYKLRNYSQHCGLPLWFNHSINKVVASDDPEIKILIYLDKYHLLNTYDSWGNTKNDILKLPEKIDFFPHFNETTNCIVDISEKFKYIIREEVKMYATLLDTRIKHLRTDGVKVCIFSEIQTDLNGKLTNFSIDYVPCETIDEILK